MGVENVANVEVLPVPMLPMANGAGAGDVFSHKDHKGRKERGMGNGAHLRDSPPSLLMIGNNYLKQLAFGARARGLAAASQFALRAHPT